MKYCLPVLAAGPFGVDAIHHMKLKLTSRQSNGSNNTPLVVTNYCADTVYPGIITQSGNGPQSSGFELSSGSNMSQTVSSDWQGRVWGRTNCTFNNNGGGGKSSSTACGTGDCNGAVECQVTASFESIQYLVGPGLTCPGQHSSHARRVYTRCRRRSDVLRRFSR